MRGLDGKRLNSGVISAVTIAIAVAATAGGKTYGQDRQTAEQDGAKLSEVVVTARRRTEAAQDVPMSVSALSGDELASRGIVNLRDLGGLFAGVSFNDSNSTVAQFSIRGLNSAGSGSDSSVGVYVDEVFIGDEASLGQRLLDVASFEVLRGPQGTLFGRNTVAGSVNVVTVAPRTEFGGSVQSSFGNYGLRQYGVVLNVPIAEEKLLTRISYVQRKRDGYLKNTAPRGGLGNEEDGESFRFRALSRPNDSLTVGFNFDLSRDNACENMFKVIGGSLYAGDTNPDKSAWDGPCTSKRDASTMSLRVDQEFDSVTLSSISAYRERETEFLTDRDFTAVSILSSGLNSDENQFTQEVRLASKSDGPLSWTIGAYYFNRNYTQDTILDLGPGFLGPGRRNIVNATARTETDSFAGFGSLEYKLTDAWRGEIGLRYTYEDKKLSYVQTATFPIPGFGVVAPFKADTNGGELSPTATLSYFFSEDVMAYGRIARGFRSSGFNTAVSSNPSRIAFAPEFVTTYEVGYRSLLADGRLRLEGAAFYLDYTDIQVADQTGAGFYIGNAAEARSYGAELQMAALATEHLTLNATAGYVNARYEEYGARTGNELPRAPRWTAALSVDWRVPMAGGEAFLLPEITYRSANFVDSANTRLFRQPNNTLVNLRAGFRAQQGWSVSVWGRNVTDERFNLGGFSVAPILFAVTTSPPATYGVDLRWEF